jgi:hypothetical protein
MSGFDRPFPVDPTVEPNLVVQMDRVSGKHFLLPLTVQAAQKLILVLKYELERAALSWTSFRRTNRGQLAGAWPGVNNEGGLQVPDTVVQRPITAETRFL